MKKILLSVVWLASIMLVACVKTPEKKAIQTRVEGIKKEALIAPLPEEKKIVLQKDEKWEDSYEVMDGKVNIDVAINVNEISIGNLPVIEVEQTALSEERLKSLVNYFSKERDVYKIPKLTVEELTSWREKILGNQGLYGNPLYDESRKQVQIQKIEQLLSSAVENPIYEKKEVRYGTYYEDDYSFITKREGTENKNQTEECVFLAEVNNNGSRGQIYATNLSEKAAEVGTFSYTEGVYFSESDLLLRKWYIQSSLSEFAENAWLLEDGNLMEKMETKMQQVEIGKEEVKERTRKILEDLEITGMAVSDIEATVFYPVLNGDRYVEDLENAEIGYLVSCYKDIQGISAVNIRGEQTSTPEENYKPPFEQEMISMVITPKGLRTFKWSNIIKESKTVSENTKAMTLGEMKDGIIKHLSYSAHPV